MNATALVVSICVLAQTQAPPPGQVIRSRLAEPQVLAQTPPQAAAESSETTALAEALARELVRAEDEQASGRAVTLLELLGPLVDRRQQIDVTLAYWGLWAALADYQIEKAEVELAEQLLPPAANPTVAVAPELEAQLAAGHARLREAELAFIGAQYELVERARRPTTEPLPLPADSPHVGPYRTHFQQIYGGRGAPARAHLIDRSLPLRRKALNVRAAAVQSALDAAQAAVDSQIAQAESLSVAIGAISELGLQRKAFVHAAREYNREIAEYALGIAPLDTPGASLVAMLIKTPNQAASAAAPDAAGGVERASFNAPLGQPSGPQEPTLAEPLSSFEPADPRGNETPAGASDAIDEEESAPGRGPNRLRLQPATRDELPKDNRGRSRQRIDELESDQGGPPSDDPAGDLRSDRSGKGRQSAVAVLVNYRQPPAGREPAKLPPDDPLAEDGVSEQDEAALEGVADPAIGDAAGETAQDSPGQSAGDDNVEPATHLAAPRKAPAPQVDRRESPLQKLADLPPAQRTQRLAATLHSAKRASLETGRNATLDECLARARGSDRFSVIAAYWQAREALAHWLVATRRNEQVRSLAASALQSRALAGGPEAMLRLRTAEFATEADLVDAELSLLFREFALMQATGQPLDQPWMAPDTVPHAGSYRLKLEAQPEWVVASAPVQRLSQSIPGLHKLLIERAAAIVAADAARAEMAWRYANQEATVDEAIAAIQRQAQETDAFLATQTEYNLKIADYALIVLPSGTADAKLLTALVVRPRS